MVKVHAGNIVYPCFRDSKDLGVFLLSTTLVY